MIERINNCPVCGEIDSELAVNTVDYSTSQEHFAIHKCLKCSHLYTNPRIKEEGVGPYYDNPDYISHTNENKGLFGRTYQFLRGINLQRKITYVDRFYSGKGVVLDYGCGTGQFLEALVDSGKKSVGVEINENAKKAAERFGSVYPSIEQVSQGIELITMWHVLEHVYDIHSLLEEFKKRMLKGGHLLVAVPNPESYDAKYYNEFWAAWDVPIHVHHYTENSIKTLMAQHGFSLETVIPMKLDSYYISLLSEQYKSNTKKRSVSHWLKGFYVGAWSNLKAKNTNTSSKIYVLKYG
jgi:2-polyprenyl-3-methyl-5-hydroxy-6-metoxy-1,4-benzoquinol methylase